jgi:hypothetical protein
VLRIHGARVIDSEHGRPGEPITGEVRLAAGTHPYVLWVLGDRLPTVEWDLVGV